MPDEWFYVQDKKKMGPVSLVQLRDLVAQGQIGRTDMLLQGGTTRWLTAESVEGLFPGAPEELPFGGFGGPPEPAPDPGPPADHEAFAEAAETTRLKPHQG